MPTFNSSISDMLNKTARKEQFDYDIGFLCFPIYTETSIFPSNFTLTVKESMPHGKFYYLLHAN
jgi:hypothetical protein